MSLISNMNLQTVIDKLARFAAESVGDPEFSGAFNAGFSSASGHVFSGGSSLASFVLGLGDEDQVADLLPPARDLDETNPTPPANLVVNAPGIGAMLIAIDKHFQRFGYNGLDAYLSSINSPTPTLRAHGMFRRYLGKVTAPNSFLPNDLVVATFNITGATTGTYAHSAAIDTTQYAGAKLVVKNVTALTGTTGVTVTGKKLDGTTASLTASVSTLTINHETDLSDVTMKFVDVTNIAVTGGTNGDEIEIVAKTDRSIASA